MGDVHAVVIAFAMGMFIFLNMLPEKPFLL
jgi:hypothetical protein